MQTSSFNKRHDVQSGGSILGIDADAIARLPQRFRGEMIAALTEAEHALASGDEALQRAATAKLKKLLGAIDARRSEAITEKALAMREYGRDPYLASRAASSPGVTKRN